MVRLPGDDPDLQLAPFPPEAAFTCKAAFN